MVRPKGVEPLTARFVAEYSIQLSYGRFVVWRIIYPIYLKNAVFWIYLKPQYCVTIIENSELFSANRALPCEFSQIQNSSISKQTGYIDLTIKCKSSPHFFIETFTRKDLHYLITLNKGIKQ